MHETFIIEKIINEANKLGKVKEIELELGELCNITKEDLEEHLIEMTNWKVKINLKKSLVKCKCGYEGSPKILERGHDFCLFCCPKCNKKPEILKGGKIKIIEVN
ncbi:MAG: hydrogenase/urease maturation nickel metallochaperone HypA [archaeon]|nr:hydrogenase/urease maturation nickel metallochaperone HypA [archaeon]